jgi:hypothetical protein
MSISDLRLIIRDLIREVEADPDSVIREFSAVGAGGGSMAFGAGGPQIMGHMSAPAPFSSKPRSKKRRRTKRKLN